jgi:hypothetical protein
MEVHDVWVWRFGTLMYVDESSLLVELDKMTNYMCTYVSPISR